MTDPIFMFSIIPNFFEAFNTFTPSYRNINFLGFPRPHSTRYRFWKIRNDRLWHIRDLQSLLISLICSRNLLRCDVIMDHLRINFFHYIVVYIAHRLVRLGMWIIRFRHVKQLSLWRSDRISFRLDQVDTEIENISGFCSIIWEG